MALRSIPQYDSADLITAPLRAPSLLRVGTVQMETETGEAWSVTYSNGDLLIVTRLSDLHQEWRLGDDWRTDEYRLPTQRELAQFSVAQRPDLDRVRSEERDGEPDLADLITDEDETELTLAHHHYVTYTPGRHNGSHHPPEHLCQRCGLSADDAIHQDVRGWVRRQC